MEDVWAGVPCGSCGSMKLGTVELSCRGASPACTLPSCDSTPGNTGNHSCQYYSAGSSVQYTVPTQCLFIHKQKIYCLWSYSTACSSASRDHLVLDRDTKRKALHHRASCKRSITTDLTSYSCSCFGRSFQKTPEQKLSRQYAGTMLFLMCVCLVS